MCVNVISLKPHAREILPISNGRETLMNDNSITDVELASHLHIYFDINIYICINICIDIFVYFL